MRRTPLVGALCSKTWPPRAGPAIVALELKTVASNTTSACSATTLLAPPKVSGTETLEPAPPRALPTERLASASRDVAQSKARSAAQTRATGPRFSEPQRVRQH